MKRLESPEVASVVSVLADQVRQSTARPAFLCLFLGISPAPGKRVLARPCPSSPALHSRPPRASPLPRSQALLNLGPGRSARSGPGSRGVMGGGGMNAGGDSLERRVSLKVSPEDVLFALQVRC